MKDKKKIHLKSRMHAKAYKNHDVYHAHRPLFKIGRTFASPRVLELCIDINQYLYRHQNGDPGNLSDESKPISSSCFRSRFLLPEGSHLYIITNREQSLTCIMLDDEMQRIAKNQADL